MKKLLILCTLFTLLFSGCSDSGGRITGNFVAADNGKKEIELTDSLREELEDYLEFFTFGLMDEFDSNSYDEYSLIETVVNYAYYNSDFDFQEDYLCYLSIDRLEDIVAQRFNVQLRESTLFRGGDYFFYTEFSGKPYYEIDTWDMGGGDAITIPDVRRYYSLGGDEYLIQFIEQVVGYNGEFSEEFYRLMEARVKKKGQSYTLLSYKTFAGSEAEFLAGEQLFDNLYEKYRMIPASLANYPVYQSFLKGDELRGIAQDIYSGSEWEFLIRVTNYFPDTGLFAGELRWPSLGAIHRINGFIIDGTLAFEETEAIVYGEAPLGVRYSFEPEEDGLIGYWVDEVSDMEGPVGFWLDDYNSTVYDFSQGQNYSRRDSSDYKHSFWYDLFGVDDQINSMYEDAIRERGVSSYDELSPEDKQALDFLELVMEDIFNADY